MEVPSHILGSLEARFTVLSQRDGRSWRGTIRRIGFLAGHPGCCSRPGKFGHVPETSRDLALSPVLSYTIYTPDLEFTLLGFGPSAGLWSRSKPGIRIWLLCVAACGDGPRKRRTPAGQAAQLHLHVRL
jgi:hypothetical protein